MPLTETHIYPAEYGTFITPAGQELIAASMRNSAINIELVDVLLGSGAWNVTKNDPAVGDSGDPIDYTIEVPQQLMEPIEGARYDINDLKSNGNGITQGIIIIPAADGPFVVTEIAWRLVDGTIFAISRQAPMPKMTPADGMTVDMRLRTNLLIGTSAKVVLQVDPSVIQATQEYVDGKVGDVARKASNDVEQLRVSMTSIKSSYLVTAPTITGDTEQSYGSNISLSASGAVSSYEGTAANGAIDHYEWMKPDGTKVTGPSLLYPVPNDAELVDTVYEFQCRAHDTLGNDSPWTAHQVTVVGNRRPEIGGFTHNVPTIAVGQQVVSVAFNGATDPDGDDAQITYRIADPVNLTPSKTTGIAPGESITLMFDDVTADTTAGLTVVAVDAAGIPSSPIEITVDLRDQALVVKPTGLAPAAGAIDMDRQPFLSCTPFVTNPAGYDTHQATRFQVATDAAFASVVVDMTLGAVTTAQVDQKLEPGVKHYWRVQQQGTALGWGEWSDGLSFTTLAHTAAIGLLGGVEDDRFRDVAVGPDGSVYAVGSGGTTRDALIAKYSSDGSLIKQGSAGHTGSETFNAIAIHDGYIYVAGDNGYDGLLCKFDLDLNLIAHKVVDMNQSTNVYFEAMCIANGQIYLAGRLNDSGHYRLIALKTSLGFDLYNSARFHDTGGIIGYGVAVYSGKVYIVGQSGAGKAFACSLVETDLSMHTYREYPGGTNTTMLRCIKVSSSGKIYAAGYLSSTNSYQIPLVVRLSASLALEEKKELLIDNYNYFEGLTIAPNGNVSVVGYGSDSQPGTSGLVVTLDANLAMLGQRQLSNADYCYLKAVCSDADGNLIAVGQLRGNGAGKMDAAVVYMPANAADIAISAVPDIQPMAWRAGVFTLQSSSCYEKFESLTPASASSVINTSSLTKSNLNLTEIRSEY